MKKWLRIGDFFFITRPILFYPGWTTLLLGYVATFKHSKIFQFHHPPEKIVLALIAFGLAMGGSFILNQIADAESDRINRKLFFIGNGIISPRIAWIESIGLLLFSVVLGSLISIRFVLLIVGFVGITGYFYNFKPFEWKNKPLAGLLGNIMMGWLAFDLGVILRSNSMEFLIFKALPYVLLNTALYIFTTLPDIEGDRESEKRTIGVVLPFQVNIWIAFFLFIAGWFLAARHHDLIALTIYVGSTFYFIRVVRHQLLESTIKATKMIIFLYSIVAAAFFPWYFLWMVTGFIITRLYYKYRFDFVYPTFEGK